jgi:hypothetical protein
MFAQGCRSFPLSRTIRRCTLFGFAALLPMLVHAEPVWTLLFEFTSETHNQYGDSSSSPPSLATDAAGKYMLTSGMYSSGLIMNAGSGRNPAALPSFPSVWTECSYFTDAGHKFTVPPPPSGGVAPDTESDGAGTWVAMWSENDQVLVSRLDTNSASAWSTTEPLATAAKAPILHNGGSGTWLAVARTPDMDESDLLFARSTDSGTTWSAFQLLNSNAATDSASDLNAAIAADGQGNWIVAWQAGGRILCTRSNNNAVTWQPVASLSSSPVVTNLVEVSPGIATNGTGVWVATWRSNSTLGGTLPAGYHTLFSRSTDSGATWSPAAAVSSAPAGAGPVISHKADRWIILWDGTQATSTDGGQTWSTVANPTQGPVLAVQPGTSEGSWVVVRPDTVYTDIIRLYYTRTFNVYRINEFSGAADWMQYP